MGAGLGSYLIYTYGKCCDSVLEGRKITNSPLNYSKKAVYYYNYASGWMCKYNIENSLFFQMYQPVGISFSKAADVHMENKNKEKQRKKDVAALSINVKVGQRTDLICVQW